MYIYIYIYTYICIYIYVYVYIYICKLDARLTLRTSSSKTPMACSVVVTGTLASFSCSRIRIIPLIRIRICGRIWSSAKIGVHGPPC